ncbi:MAG: hypothetical protein E7053_08515 [Lentisphaerae bacterium]|nr:hypothetical protein [Lentisphaerota bacterium]
MDLKQLSSNRKGQLIICCIILGLVWGVLLIRYGASYLGDIPDKKKIEKARHDLEKARTELARYEEENQRHQEIRARYRALAASAWIPSIDGAVETGLRRRISDVSLALDFRLSSLSAANPVRINQQFLYADITIHGTGDLEDVIRFLAELSKIEPRLSWRQLNLTPARNQPRPAASATTANLAAQLDSLPQTRLEFRGTLRVLVYEGELTPQQLQITRQPVADEPETTEETEE